MSARSVRNGLRPLVACLGVLAAPIPAAMAAQPLPEQFGPWSIGERHPSLPERTPAAMLTPAAVPYGPTHSLSLAYLVWSRLLTAVDGPRCPHRPTCSRYASQAIGELGLVVGIVLTVDRLLHEASPVVAWPFERRAGGLVLLDPVESNLLPK